jgi:superfamily II DNA/RNA helicase
MSFSELGLSDKVLAAIEAAGYQNPTPIQAQAIPLALAGRDVIGIAQTGTGKTGAFVLPLLSKLETGRARARMPRSLILEPTRELAAQVAQSFELLGSKHKLTVALLIGGVSFDEQDRKLDRGADVLIATPGRMLDHAGRGKLLLTGVEFLVIDEADRMLDMGFIPDIERICSLLPTAKQTLFFSATMPPEIQKLTDKFLKSPERVAVSAPATAATTIVQKLRFAPRDAKAKRHVLREMMRGAEVKNAIIFCNRKRDVAIVHRSLVRHGFNAGALHGDLDQRQRTATLEAFRKGELTFLAASDVAARGLDIPEVSHVFNYDVPINAEDYVHRIGRTGRAGREGFAAMLVTPGDFESLKAIEALCQAKIEWIDGEPSADDMGGSGEGGRSRGRPRRRGASEAEPVARRSAPTRRRVEAREQPRPTREKKPHEKHAQEKPFDETAEQPVVPVRARHPQPHAPRRSPLPVRVGEEPQPVVSAAPIRAPQPEQRRQNVQPMDRDRDRRSRRSQQQDDPPVVGLGDHVPAFLMRPVRRTTTSR